MHILELFGRIFLSVLFLAEGIRKFFFQEETIMYMEDFGVPEILFFPSIFVEIFPIPSTKNNVERSTRPKNSTICILIFFYKFF